MLYNENIKIKEADPRINITDMSFRIWTYTFIRVSSKMRALVKT